MTNNSDVSFNKKLYLTIIWGLFFLFLTLQLVGSIDWPWYAVGAPILVPTALSLLFYGLAGAAHLGAKLANRRSK